MQWQSLVEIHACGGRQDARQPTQAFKGWRGAQVELDVRMVSCRTRCHSLLRLLGASWGRRSELDGQLLYILPDAVTAHSIADGGGDGGGNGPEAGRAPVPPCILPLEDATTQISLEVDDRSALQPPPVPCCNNPWAAQSALLGMLCESLDR